MGSNSSDKPEQLSIAYPTLSEWASCCDLGIDEATKALTALRRNAFGERPGMLERVSRRHYYDMYRLIIVMQQLSMLGERDALALSFRCPARMARYGEAITAAIDLARKNGTDPDTLDMAERIQALVVIFLLEVTTFYQGLS